MRRTSHLVFALFLALVLPPLGACSLALNQDKNQCQADADCNAIAAGRTCRAGVCEPAPKADVPPPQLTEGPVIPAPPPPSTALPCASPAPTCANNICVPFDNCARLGLCAGAALPPLVAPPKP